MKKVLVTGGTGLIGRETILPLRLHGYEIFVLTQKDIPDTKQVRYIKANLFDKQRLKIIIENLRPSHLLHLAWQSTGHFNSLTNYEFLTSSMELLQFFQRNGGKRAVMAGSYAEYGHRSEVLTEKLDPQPINEYSTCKNYLRVLSEAFCKTADISFCWGRIFSAFGIEDDPRRLTSYILKNLYENNQVVIRSGNLVRDYIYAKDVAEALVRLLDSPVNGIVNICSGKGIEIAEFVNLFARKMNKEHLVQLHSIPGDQQLQVIGDPHKLFAEVNFVPKYTLNSAIDEIINQYKGCI